MDTIGAEQCTVHVRRQIARTGGEIVGAPLKTKDPQLPKTNQTFSRMDRRMGLTKSKKSTTQKVAETEKIL